MQTIKVALLWVLAALPCFGQHTEVVVKRTDVVQVSNGDESPVLSQVNSVNIYYINCYNVIYCGPPSDSAPSTTYTSTSGNPPLWAAPQLLNSALFTPVVTGQLPAPIETAALYSSVVSTGLSSSSIPPIGVGTDVGKFLSGLAQQPTSLTGDQLSLSADGAALSTASQPLLLASAYTGSQGLTLSDSLKVPDWMTTSQDFSASSSVIGGSLRGMVYDGSGNIDVARFLLTASSSTSPVLTSMPTTLLGTTSLSGASFPTDLAIRGSSSLTGGLNAAIGTDAESLTQRMKSLKESGARIVSWSVMYDTSPIGNN